MLNPLKDNVLVLLDETIPSANFGFLVAPQTAAFRAKDGAIESENRGVIVKVGPGRKNSETGEYLEMSVSVGDIVRFGELEFHTDKVDGRKYALISEMDILWIEDPEEVAA